MSFLNALTDPRRQEWPCVTATVAALCDGCGQEYAPGDLHIHAYLNDGRIFYSACSEECAMKMVPAWAQASA